MKRQVKSSRVVSSIGLRNTVHRCIAKKQCRFLYTDRDSAINHIKQQQETLSKNSTGGSCTQKLTRDALKKLQEILGVKTPGGLSTGSPIDSSTSAFKDTQPVGLIYTMLINILTMAQYTTLSGPDKMSSNKLGNVNTTALSALALELERRGIMQQQFSNDEKEPSVPKNFEDIKKKLRKQRFPPVAEEEYVSYSKKVCSISNEQGVVQGLFSRYFGEGYEDDHTCRAAEKWR